MTQQNRGIGPGGELKTYLKRRGVPALYIQMFRSNGENAPITISKTRKRFLAHLSVSYTHLTLPTILLV